MPKPEFKQGIYKHYKTQGLYHALCLVKHHDSREDYVLYSSLEHGTLNIRPLFGYDKDPDGFFDVVGAVHTGSMAGTHENVLRFTYISPPKE